MNDYLQDLWYDLREKRLWPVAVVLALSLVMIPVVLAKSSEDPAPAAPVATTDSGSEEFDIKVSSDKGGSSLDRFASKDPFKPPADVRNAAKSPGDDASASPAGEGGSSSGGTGGGGGGGTTDGGASPPVEPLPPADQPPTVAKYEYVVDVTFTVGKRSRKVKGMRKLDILPNEETPLLIFMGVTKDGANAVFMVDSTLSAAGEGSCKPKPSDCAFLTIGAGSEHSFTNEAGGSYGLRIDEIRRVAVKKSGITQHKAQAAYDVTIPKRLGIELADDAATAGDVGSGDQANGR